jgi:hypothetical protein
MVLVRFSTALERHKGQMDDATYWRYKGGRLPKLLTWLAQRPELAQALAADAAALAQERGETHDDTTKGGAA